MTVMARFFPLAVSALVLLSGCASPGTRVILLPDADGKVGAVNVSNAAGNTLINSGYGRVDVSARAAPGQVKPQQSAAVKRDYAQLLAVEPPPALSILIHFELGSTRIDPVAERDIGAAVAEILARNADTVVVIGHSDTSGSDGRNDDVARERAEIVARELHAQLGEHSRIKVSSFGDRAPLIRTPGNTREPRNRRVEILIP